MQDQDAMPATLDYAAPTGCRMRLRQRRWMLILLAILTVYVGSYACFWTYRLPAANLMYFDYTEGNRSECVAFVGYYPVYRLHRLIVRDIHGDTSFTKHNWDRGGMTWSETWGEIKYNWTGKIDEDEAEPSDSEKAPATSPAFAPTRPIRADTTGRSPASSASQRSRLPQQIVNIGTDL